MFGLIRKKPEPTPRERFFKAIEKLNEAWADVEVSERESLRPWIDWESRTVQATIWRPELGREIITE